jgi:hypothetical protein
MRTFDGPITPDGALVDVLIGLSAAALRTIRNQGKPVPPPVATRALLDPGAEVSCADSQALAHIIAAGIRPVRYFFANAPALGGVTPTAEYTVSLILIHPSNNPRANLILPNQSVLEQPLGTLGYQILVGRDVLARCLFFYNGPGTRFTLGY